MQDTGTLVSNVDVTKDANNRKIDIKTTFKKAPANTTVEICAVSKSTFNFDKWIDMGYKYLNIKINRDNSSSSSITSDGAAVFLAQGNTIDSKILASVDESKTGSFKIEIETLKGKDVGLKIRSLKRDYPSGIVITSNLVTVSGWTLTAL